MQEAINNHLKDRIKLLSPKLDWTGLGSNPNITRGIVEENINKPWNWYGLSMNPNITWEVVKDNLDKPWNWYKLSRNPAITWTVVKDNLDKPWCWYYLSSNPDILMTNQERSEIVKAKVIQRYWRICVTNPNYLVCKKRLLYEHENM